MAHKKIERKKELDRRRKRRAEPAFTKLRLLPRTASKSGDLSCAGAPARSSGCAPALPLFLLCPNSGKSSGFPVVLSVKAAWSGPECPWWSESMPIYEYRCRKCGNVFEEWVKTFDSPELEPCPKCGGDAERIMSNTSFKLEGGGWFASCYGGKASGSASDAAPAADAAPAKADAAPAKAEAAASGSGGGSKAATA